MTIQVTTHLNFRGQAREALGFYQSVFGGEQTILTYGAMGASQDETQRDQVMWGQVVSERGFRVMAYDVQAEKGWNPGENAFYVSVQGDTKEEINEYWEKLAEEASILQPLGPAPWSPFYGMLKDRFGITWFMDVRAASPDA